MDEKQSPKQESSWPRAVETVAVCAVVVLIVLAIIGALPWQ